MRRPPRPTGLRRRDTGDSVCAWCEQAIPEGREVLGLAAKALPGGDLWRHQGRMMRLHLVAADRSVVAMVTGVESPANRNGQDLYFMICSEGCGATLRATLAEEIRVGRTGRSWAGPLGA